MSKHLPAFCKTIFAFLLLVVLFIPKKSFATVFTIDIALTGGQEVPSNTSTGLGNLTGTYDDATNVLSFNLVFTGLASPTTVAHFHAPAAPGVNASPVISFAGFPVGVTSGSYTNSYTITATQETQLLCGQWYVNIHTSASPAGEIRGQLTEAAPSSFNITLSGTQEVPANPSTGIANLTGTYIDATNTLSFNLVFTGLASPTTVAHFHGPAAPGVNTSPVIAFAGFPVGVTSGSYSNNYVLTAAQETQLLSGLWYVNIHTTAFPGGEIRGQLQEGTLPSNCSNQQPPAITSFNPSSGQVGTSVTITGTNFNAVPANNIVYFGAVKAAVTSGTTMSLAVTVPAGATYEPISVLDNVTGLKGYSSKPFITTFANPFGTGIPSNYYKPKVDFTVGNLPNSNAIGDLDGDGKPDIVIANSNAANISVLRNTSITGNIDASSFAAKVDFTTVNAPSFVAIGDLDGDGKPDLVLANGNATTISVLRNTSTTGSITTSSFATPIDFNVGNNPLSIAIADVDGDGKPEVVVANAGTFNVSVLRNISTQGSISASSFATKVDFTTGSGTYPVSVATGDLDGDGKLDLVLSNLFGTTLSVLRNTSTKGSINTSSFAAKVDFTVGNGPFTVAIGDVDGDNKPDLVTANNSGVAPFTISVLRNTSTSGTIDAGSFAAKVDFTTGNSPRTAAIGDLDGDGKPDIVVANSASVSSSISVLRNTSTSGIIDGSSFAAKVDFTTGTSPRYVAIGDLDGDGIPEIAAANGNSNTVSVFQINLTAAPVTLTSVKAYKQNNGVLVEWTAQQESNIDSYDVERSQTGQQFIKLESVKAKGNSSVLINYHLFDPAPFSGINFYRIKIIEAGHATYSQVLKVNISDGSKNLITIYPNPINGNTIALEMNLQKGSYTLTLTNKLGQQIINKVIEHAGGIVYETIEPSNIITAGIYQLRLTGGDVDITRQLIKN